MPNAPRSGHQKRVRKDPQKRGPGSSPEAMKVLYHPQERRPVGSVKPQAVTRGKVREHLVQARLASERADRRIEEWVVKGRILGMTWAEIGRVLGMSGQGAGKRFRHLHVGALLADQRAGRVTHVTESSSYGAAALRERG